jgi:diguanylate cyclase (GGDEF)-like protein
VFRETYLEQSLPRARLATGIYLALMLSVAVIHGLGILHSGSDDASEFVQFLLLAIASLTLALLFIAANDRFLGPHYPAIAGTSVIVLGCGVMATSSLAAATGSPQYQMLDVLLVVYVSLFAGLTFRIVAPIVGALLVVFLVTRVATGASIADLAFAGAVLLAATFMAVGSTARFERLTRTHFIEARWLNEIAETDSLTGLYNRRGFDHLANKLWQQACRDQQWLQVVLIDVDYFKQFNDLYGHQAGDACIQQISRIIRGMARRPLDVCARYGGEEFVLVYYSPARSDPKALAEQCRQAVMAESIRHAGSAVAAVVTVSVGSAAAQPHAGQDLAALIRKADEALYRAKLSGRNRTVHKDLAAVDFDTGQFGALKAG